MARDWRNCTRTRLETDARFVVLHGDNGQGKTNLLEAVYTLAALRSFRENRAARLVRQGAEEAELRAEVRGHSGLRRLRWRWSKASGRRLNLDDRGVSELSEWFGVLRAIAFCPEHGAIVRGEPAERRGFVDRAAFTAEPAHLDVVRDYRRALRQKATLLREGRATDALVEPWDHRLAELGARLVERRARIVAALQAPFQEMYATLLHRPQPEPVELRFRGFAAKPEGDLRGRLLAAFHEARADERRRGRVLVGPHRDDLDIRVAGRLARNFASQGQARSVVLALKLAELRAAEARGDQPLFLLDDLTSELDRGRMARLIGLLGRLESQVWITTTDPRWLGPLPGGEARLFRVSRGEALGAGVSEE